MQDKVENLLILSCPDELSGKRLDQVLSSLLPEHSRAFIKKVITAGGVHVGGKEAKSSRKIKVAEEIQVLIPAPDPLDAKPEDLPLEVIYEDTDLIVINKQPGMVAHPSMGHRDGTLVNALLHHYGDSLSAIGGVLRPGIVHRLDKDTTGCLVAAKNDTAHRKLIEQFMSRSVRKTYLAITDGVPKPVEGIVEGQIGRNPKDRQKHALLKSGGRHSLTHYKTLENYGALSLVECDLKTGRTHQARVHLAHLGSPVLCDKEYGRQEMYTSRDLAKAVVTFKTGEKNPRIGGDELSKPSQILLRRQALHAWKLAFNHPINGRELAFEAPIPADMLSILAPLQSIRHEMESRDRR